MSDHQLLLLFLGILAICVVIITVVIVFVAIQYSKTIHKVNAFIAVGQNSIYALLNNLSDITKEGNILLKRLGNESQFLTLKASSGIATITNASLAFKALSQFFNKNPEIKGDSMNNNNLLSFTLGAAIAGMGAYYVFKNKDEISNKINAIEETLADDYGDLLSKGKAKLDELIKSFQATAQDFLQSETVDKIKENELKLLVKKLDKLQKEIELLSVKS